MFKRILVPLGDSSHTATTLTCACELARVFGGSIKCLYITDVEKIKAALSLATSISEPIMELESVESVEAFDEAQREITLEEKTALYLFDRWKREYPDVPLTIEKTGGVIEKEILKREESFDLVVISRHYDATEEEVGDHIGSTVRWLLHHSKIPLLVCTQDHFIGVNLLACFDGKPHSVKALEYAIEVAKAFGVELPVLSTDEFIQKKAEERKQKALDIAKAKKFKIKPLVFKLNTIGAIVGEVNHLNVNFLFMGAYGDNPIKDLLLGSTTEGVLSQVRCPVFLCRS